MATIARSIIGEAALIIHLKHYGDVIMSTIASQITSLTIVYSTVYSDADQSKHQSSASQAFVRGLHRGPVNSPHKRPVTWKMFPFDDVIMSYLFSLCVQTPAPLENSHQSWEYILNPLTEFENIDTRSNHVPIPDAPLSYILFAIQLH